VKRREYILALIAGAIVLIAVAERLVFSPLGQAWHRLADRVSAQQAALASAEGLLKRADMLRARYRSSAAAAEGDPDTRKIDFLTFLQSSAGRAGVRVGTETPTRVAWRGQVSPGAGRSDQGVRYGECTVSLTFSSSMEALVRFLTELAAGKEAVRVRYLSLVGEDPAGRSLKVTLRLSTVVLSAEAGQPAEPHAGRSPGLVAVGLGGVGWWSGASGGSAEGRGEDATGWGEVGERVEAEP
jgi:hypothetical protein